MNTILKYILLSICTVLLGGFIGYSLGFQQGFQQHAQVQKTMGMDQLRQLLKEKEAQHILDLVRISADVNRVDEGGFFTTKYVHYLQCKILNAASVATVKDVKLRVDFLSKTDALINSQEINVYEFIRPNREHTLKHKLKWPKEADKFKASVIAAGYDSQ